MAHTAGFEARIRQTTGFQAERRKFFIGSAKSGAAVTALSLGSGGMAGLGFSSLAEAAPVAAEDLLQSLGERIAIEVQSQIGTTNAGYSVHFVDTAGPSCDGLREGLRQALSGHGLQFEEVQGQAMGSLARVTVKNLETGRQVSIDLLPESLSQISLIEERSQDPVVRRHLLNQAASETLYQRLMA